jgi:hypothetical protein
MIEYVAHFDEAAEKAAARTFFVRSFRELRFWRTVLPPFVFAGALAILYAIASPMWVRIEMWIFFIVAVLGPAFFYLVLPLDAARRARKIPSRRVQLTPEAFGIEVGARKIKVPWSRFRRLWNAKDYMFLIITPYTSIKLPTDGMPDEARNLIVQSIRRQA